MKKQDSDEAQLRKTEKKSGKSWGLYTLALILVGFVAIGSILAYSNFSWTNIKGESRLQQTKRIRRNLKDVNVNNKRDNFIKDEEKDDEQTDATSKSSSSKTSDDNDSIKPKTGKEKTHESDDGKDMSESGQKSMYHSMVADQISAKNIDDNLKYLSAEEHMAGTPANNERAEWYKDKLESYGCDNVIMKKYRVLLSYPLGPGNITMLDENGKELNKFTVLEKNLDPFEKTAKPIMPPFLAYSASGDITGDLVYANYGSEDDFRALKEIGVDIEDKIIMIRYGHLSRNKKIKYGQQYKVKGIILFSDPENYALGGVSYPDSWYLPPDGVQRGTLLQMRGDALTRGYPAIDGLYRRPISEVGYLPTIPVQPLGYGQAEKIFSFLDGKSPPSDKFKGLMNTTYKIDSKGSKQIRLQVDVSREMKEITNVIGVLTGSVEPDRYIIIGNHRDAWGYGASDPSSGAAVIVEIARALSWLRKKGWKPRRTIMFASWDAEEYGLLGSTEWVEEHAKLLSHNAVAYINVDTAVQGNHTMELKATPELRDTFFDAAQRFKDPDVDKNLYFNWINKVAEDEEDTRKEPNAKMFREGSDYMPFYASLGIPSMDTRYTFSTKDQGVFNYPVYHTKHDNYYWMKKFIDPDMRYHVTIAKVMMQVVLQLCDTELLPFNLVRYGESVASRAKKLERIVKKHKLTVDISLLKKSAEELRVATHQFHSRIKDIDKKNDLAVRIANDQMLLFERTFVTSEDLPGEPGITRHVYHTGGLMKALGNLINKREDSKKEFELKYSIYTYHIRMATQALDDPFLKPPSASIKAMQSVSEGSKKKKSKQSDSGKYIKQMSSNKFSKGKSSSNKKLS